MIPLPDKFQKDILSRNTALQPLIVIGWDTETKRPLEDALYIAQIKTQFNTKYNDEDEGESVFFDDLNLAISSIKENINIETRKFSINNVNITLSNDTNYSDTLSTVDLVNKKIAIFWKSQSAKKLGDCLLVYVASVTRYTHDDKTIKIQLEDETQKKISKQVPIANLGTGERVYSDKYINKTIPMVYGAVDFAPAVVWPRLPEGDNEGTGYDDSGYWVIADDVRDSLDTSRGITGYLSTPERLTIYRGDYWYIREDRSWDTGDVYDGNVRSQTELTNDNSIFVRKQWNGDDPYNPPAANFIQARRRVRPTMLQIKNEDDELVSGANTGGLGPIWVGTTDNSDGTQGMEFRQRRNAIDDWSRGTNIEAEIFNLDSQQDTYAMFPDNDLTDIPEAELPPDEDLSNDFSTAGSLGGNFLEFSPIPVNNAHTGWYICNWMQYHGYEPGIRPEFLNSRPSSPPTGHMFQEGVDDQCGEDFWDNDGDDRHELLMWNVEWPSIGMELCNILPKSYNYNSTHEGRNTNNYYTQGYGGRREGKLNPYTEDTDWYHIYQGNVDIERSFGTLIDSTSGDLNATNIFRPCINQVKNMYADTWGLKYIQIPSTEKIRDKVDTFLFLEGYHGVGYETDSTYHGQDEYSSINITDKRMHSPDSEYGSNVSGMQGYFGSQAQVNSSNGGNWGNGSGGTHKSMFMGQDCSPYGNLVWFFGFDITPEGTAQKFVAVTFDGRFEVNEMLYEDAYNQHPNTLYHTMSLMEMFDFNESCIFSVDEWVSAQTDQHYNTKNVSNGGFGDFTTYTISASPTRKDYYNSKWNGKSVDNYDFLGSPGGEHTRRDKTSLLHGGGVGRWFVLFTKDGMLETPGCLQPSWSNEFTAPEIDDFYDEDLDNLLYGNTGYNPDYPASPFDTNIINNGALREGTFDIIESNEYITLRGATDNDINDNQDMSTMRRWALRCQIPSIGADGAISDSARVGLVYDVRVGIEPDIQFQGDSVLMFYARATDEGGNAATTSAVIKNMNGGEATGYVFPYMQNSFVYDNTLVISNKQHWLDQNNPDLYWLKDAYFKYNNLENNYVGSEQDTGGWMDTTTGLDGQGTDSWYDVNRYNNFSLHFLVQHRDGNVDSLPCNISIYDLYLNLISDFDDLDDSDFYIEHYKGRSGADGNYLYGPANIIKDLVQTELGYDGDVSSGDVNEANSELSGWKLGFSITKMQDSKKLIEDICTNTPLFPRLRGESSFGFITLKKSYDSLGEQDYSLVHREDLLKFKFTRTKVEDIKTLIEVKFNYNHATQDYDKSSGWFSCKDFLGDGDLDENVADGGYRLGLYNLGTSRDISDVSYRDEDETSLVFEARYITDISSAWKLQEFLAMWHCNYHLIVKVDLSLKFVNLEAGDIFKFNELMANKKAYGEDYTEELIRNGQVIYPYFLITSITRKKDMVSVEGIQLHNLTRKFSSKSGDVSRRGTEAGTENTPDGVDYQMLLDYLDNKETTRFTRDQIKSMDVNGSGGVTIRDATFWDLFVMSGTI